jgi:hypothetical protein
MEGLSMCRQPHQSLLVVTSVKFSPLVLGLPTVGETENFVLCWYCLPFQHSQNFSSSLWPSLSFVFRQTEQENIWFISFIQVTVIILISAIFCFKNRVPVLTLRIRHLLPFVGCGMWVAPAAMVTGLYTTMDTENIWQVHWVWWLVSLWINAIKIWDMSTVCVIDVSNVSQGLQGCSGVVMAVQSSERAVLDNFQKKYNLLTLNCNVTETLMCIQWNLYLLFPDNSFSWIRCSISMVPERILFQLWLPHLLFSRIHCFFFRPPTKTMNRGSTVLVNIEEHVAFVFTTPTDVQSCLSWTKMCASLLFNYWKREFRYMIWSFHGD